MAHGELAFVVNPLRVLTVNHESARMQAGRKWKIVPLQTAGVLK